MRWLPACFGAGPEPADEQFSNSRQNSATSTSHGGTGCFCAGQTRRSRHGATGKASCASADRPSTDRASVFKGIPGTADNQLATTNPLFGAPSFSTTNGSPHVGYAPATGCTRTSSVGQSPSRSQNLLASATARMQSNLGAARSLGPALAVAVPQHTGADASVASRAHSFNTCAESFVSTPMQSAHSSFDGTVEHVDMPALRTAAHTQLEEGGSSESGSGAAHVLTTVWPSVPLASRDSGLLGKDSRGFGDPLVQRHSGPGSPLAPKQNSFLSHNGVHSVTGMSDYFLDPSHFLQGTAPTTGGSSPHTGAPTTPSPGRPAAPPPPPPPPPQPSGVGKSPLGALPGATVLQVPPHTLRDSDSHPQLQHGVSAVVDALHASSDEDEREEQEERELGSGSDVDVGDAIAAADTVGLGAVSAGLPGDERDASVHGHAAVLHTVRSVYRKHNGPCTALNHLMAYCKQHGLTQGDLQAHLERAGDLGEDREAVARLVGAVGMMEQALETALDDSGWEIVQDDALRVCYQHVPGSSVHSFKGRCTVDAPIEHLVALAREFDLCKTWNKYCGQSVVLKEHSQAELLCAASMWMPWPLSDLNVVVEAVGADVLQQAGGFMIAFQSPADFRDPSLIEGLPGINPSSMYLKMLAGSCVFFEPLPPLTPGGPHRTRATLQARTDPGLKHVPGFLVSFVLKVLAPFMYNVVVKLLKHEFSNPAAPLPARLQQRPELYNLVRKHAAQYLASAQAARVGGRRTH